MASLGLPRVEPGRTGGREVHVKARVLGQPGLDLGVLVRSPRPPRGVVVYDQVQFLLLLVDSSINIVT